MARRAKPTHKIDIEINDADYAEHAAEHPDDASVVGFRVGTLRELQQMSDELKRLTEEVEELNGLLVRYQSSLYRLTAREIAVLEVFLSLASLWAAFTLWNSPSLFESSPVTFRIIDAFHGNELSWAAFALVAALLKLIGIATCMTGDPSWGRTIRYVGLAMSGLFWSLMGGGVMLGDPHTLFGFNSLLMGLFSWWSLLRLVR